MLLAGARYIASGPATFYYEPGDAPRVTLGAGNINFGHQQRHAGRLSDPPALSARTIPLPSAVVEVLRELVALHVDPRQAC